MTNYEKYLQFCNQNSNLDCESFYSQLAFTFKVSLDTAALLFIVSSASWFKPEMFDEIIRLDNPEYKGYRPNFGVDVPNWNYIDNCFIPNEG